MMTKMMTMYPHCSSVIAYSPLPVVGGSFGTTTVGVTLTVGLDVTVVVGFAVGVALGVTVAAVVGVADGVAVGDTRTALTDPTNAKKLIIATTAAFILTSPPFRAAVQPPLHYGLRCIWRRAL